MKKNFAIIALMLYALAAGAQQRPNVIFILADDLGYGDLACYGQKLIITPNIDRLAAGGMRFTQMYAGTSVCAPSRASLMTGLHTGHTPIRGNYEIQPEGQLPIPAATFILPQLFKAAGYHTGAFGKWGLGYPGSEGDPMKKGFDRFYGYNCQRQSHNFFPDHLWDNSQRVNLANDTTYQLQYAPDLIQRHALAFMNNNRNVPFFLYLAYTLPHAALQLPAGDSVFAYYKRKFNEQPRPVKAWVKNGYQPQPYPRAAYAAMVSKLDNYVGQIVAKLKALGLNNNTLIVFTSDNGPHIEGGNDPAFFNSSGGLRGIKRQLYEGGIREPFIASWPGHIKPAQTSAHVGAFWDFMPTFAALTNRSLPAATDGNSLLPTLLGKGRQEQHDFLYWEFHEDGGRQALRMGKWKAVKENVMINPDKLAALYDLEKDPAETMDLAAKYPAKLQQMLNMMRKEHIEQRNFPFVTK